MMRRVCHLSTFRPPVDNVISAHYRIVFMGSVYSSSLGHFDSVAVTFKSLNISLYLKSKYFDLRYKKMRILSLTKYVVTYISRCIAKRM